MDKILFFSFAHFAIHILRHISEAQGAQIIVLKNETSTIVIQRRVDDESFFKGQGRFMKISKMCDVKVCDVRRQKLVIFNICQAMR